MLRAQSLGRFNTISKEKNAPKMEEIDIFDERMENYDVEASALHRKLKSKIEALRILRKELERFRNERDQFKLMAETLQLRYSSVKRTTDCGNNNGGMNGKPKHVTNLLLETREHNIKLTTEVELLKHKVAELQGDLDLLRIKEAQMNDKKGNDGNVQQQAMDKEEQQWKKERSNFISHLENLKKKNAQLAFDFKSIIDEREGIIMERDAYKCKAHRLNHELFAVMNVNKSHPKFLDVDSIILENRYLQERLRNVEIELNSNKQTLTRLKNFLDSKRKKSILKIGTETNDKSLLTHKQVKQIVDNGIYLPGKPETIEDFRTLCCSILEQLNDKNLALNHQKKANKTLATRIDDLEKRIKALLSAHTSDSNCADFSPSEILLRDYCPAAVDGSRNEAENLAATTKFNANDEEEEEEEDNEEQEDCATLSPQHNHLGKCTPEPSEDGLTSLSTESGRSLQSSEYACDVDADNLSVITNSDYYANNHHNSAMSIAFTSVSDITKGKSLLMAQNTITQRRREEFKDLPPDLAAMVQKALHELDMQEFHSDSA